MVYFVSGNCIFGSEVSVFRCFRIYVVDGVMECWSTGVVD